MLRGNGRFMRTVFRRTGRYFGMLRVFRMLGMLRLVIAVTIAHASILLKS
jgi:hypothetical protein